MKKKFTFLLAALMLLTMMVLPGEAVGQEKTAFTGTFTKCTGSLTTGTYIIGVVENNTIHAINNTVGTSWIKYTDVTISSNQIVNPDATVVWTYDSSTGYIKNNDNTNYIYWTSGNVGCCGTTAYAHDVTETQTSGIYTVKSHATTSRILRQNGTSGYRYYATSTGSQSISFFKLDESPAITATPSPFIAPSYVEGTVNPTTANLTVTGSNLNANVTATLNGNSNFQIQDGDNWVSTITLTQSRGSVNGTIAIRLMPGLTQGSYNGTITLSSTGADDVVVNLTGSVTKPTHELDYYSNSIANGSFTFSPASPVPEDASVTLTPSADPGYELSEWTFYKESGEDYVVDNSIDVTNNTFSMPHYDLWVDATFSAKQTFAVECVANPVAGGTLSVSPSLAYEGQTVTLTYDLSTNYTLTSIVITKKSDGSATSITPAAGSGSTYTFTMPGYAVTATATFAERHSLDIDFESENASTYTDWTFTFVNTHSTNANVTAHGGSYFGSTSISFSNANSIIVTKNKIANPQSLTCYVTRQTTNDTQSTWYIEVSDNGSDWTEVTTQSAISMVRGTWVEVSAILTSYHNVYVRVRYTGSSAVRCIDDLSLVYTPSEYSVTLSSVSGGSISASDGTTPITSGSHNFESGKTITLTAEGDASHMFNSWSVSGATVADASLATTTFEMPANAVTVGATFVESWTFTYNINGHTVTEKYLRNNANITLPTTSEYIPDGYSLRGWTENESDLSEPIFAAMANQDRTFYAIFGKNVYGDFVKVEENLTDWTGYYLIVYEDGNVAFDGSRSGIDLDGTPNSITVSISSQRIEHNDATEASMFTVAKNGDYYTILSASGYYIGRTTSTNGFEYDENTKYNHSIAYSDGITITSSGGPTLQYYKNAENSKFRYYASSQKAISLYKSEILLSGSYTRVIPETVKEDIIITVPTYVASGSVVDMGSYNITCNNAANLIIEDGAEIILNSTNTGVKATFIKNITSAAKDNDVWYTISTPIGGINITDVTNLVDNEGHTLKYNLYRYNESLQSNQWEAYNPTNHDDFTTLVKGKGYLYRNNGKSLSFAGEVNVGNVTGITLTSTAASGDLRGFNLIGNPFGHTIYKGEGAAIDNTSLNEGFYYLTETGEWIAGDYKTPITPRMGILVQVSSSITSLNLTISDTDDKASSESKYANDNLQFMVSNNDYEDVAYAIFRKGEGLNKINHRNAKAPMIYIPQENEDYAIAMMSDDTKMFGLNFKAATMGQYTLSYKAEGNFDYLHVIDRLTGADVDMLIEGNYTFVATPNDNENRFIVQLAYKPDYSEGNNDIFAYQTGSEILISGSGELQIFDVTGRMIMNTNINGAEAINVTAQGVYILRLVGTEVKTQKIVVR